MVTSSKFETITLIIKCLGLSDVSSQHSCSLPSLTNLLIFSSSVFTCACAPSCLASWLPHWHHLPGFTSCSPSSPLWHPPTRPSGLSFDLPLGEHWSQAQEWPYVLCVLCMTLVNRLPGPHVTVQSLLMTKCKIPLADGRIAELIKPTPTKQ